MQNTFDENFGAWPERGYIFLDKKLVFIVDLSNLMWIESIENWLSNHFANLNN